MRIQLQFRLHVFSENKLEEKPGTRHLHQGRRRLVGRAADWKWSSAQWYLQRKSVGIPIGMPDLWNRGRRPALES